MTQEIDQFIEKRKKQYTNLLVDLIKAKTVNPPGDEYVAAKVVRKHLSKIGIKCKVYEKKKRRTNLVAKLGDTKGKRFLISTHLDVVPAGDGWDTDPFKAEIIDNKLFGRGAADNKGQATAVMLVMEYLKKMEKQLHNQFIFVFAADEELGSGLGVKYLLKEGKIDADFAIMPDVSGAMKNVTIAEKGVLNLKVTCKGKQAHGSTPQKGISAIACMAKFIAKLEHHILKHEMHKYLTRPSINFGTIQGGSAPNSVAAHCEMVLNIRWLPSQTPESIIEELRKLSERFGVFEFETLISAPPTEVDDRNELVQTIIDVAAKHDITTKPKGLSGATDCKSFVLADIPAVGFDFGDEYVPHNANEYCNLDNLFKFVHVLIDILVTLDEKQVK